MDKTKWQMEPSVNKTKNQKNLGITFGVENDELNQENIEELIKNELELELELDLELDLENNK
jgi:hypothetical protein